MKKSFKILLVLTALLGATENKIMHAHAMEVGYKDQTGKSIKTTVARDMYLKCRKVPFEPREYWRENFAISEIDGHCKAEYITAAGKISPIKMGEGIDTYGELEVLDFLEEMQEDENMLFIDARKTKWFNELTIPGAINIPFVYFTEKNKWIREKKSALVKFGVKETEQGYDFKKAKTILLFCNAIWCRQSPQMIEELIKIGYPKEKMKWYRGGLQSWTSVGMTTYRPVKLKKKETPKWWFDILVQKFEHLWDEITPS